MTDILASSEGKKPEHAIPRTIFKIKAISESNIVIQVMNLKKKIVQKTFPLQSPLVSMTRKHEVANLCKAQSRNARVSSIKGKAFHLNLIVTLLE